MTIAPLAYIPSPSQGVWHLGPVPLRAYALFIVLGIIVAVWWGGRRWVARGGREGEILDIAIWAVPFGLIGGRLYHVITDWKTYFGDTPGDGKDAVDALRIWEGGLGIWGAVAFGAVGAWIGARRYGIKLPAFGDAVAPPIILAQAIGRLGNYFNQELYGRETDVPWALKIYERVDEFGNRDAMNGVSTGVVEKIVHPTFLYELLWNLLVVLILVAVDRYARIGHGRLFALYVALYCVGRLGVELMRSDPATHIAGIRINVFTACVIFAIAAAYFVIAPKGREQGLTMYRDAKAAELEELGHVGYIDEYDYYEDDEVEPEPVVDPQDALTEAIARHTGHTGSIPAITDTPDDEAEIKADEHAPEADADVAAEPDSEAEPDTEPDTDVDPTTAVDPATADETPPH